MTHYVSKKPKTSNNSSKKWGSSARSSGSQGSGKGRQSARPIKKFDPSLFIKKVEEQVVAAPYVPKHMFADFELDAQIKENIVKKGYMAPTPIQDESIPYLLAGRDLVGTANTGTGKTAAFLLPLIHNILIKKTNRALIIAPTRELAGQIQEELKSFAHRTGLFSVLCIGGVNVTHQVKDLKQDPEFVIGTPGRLIDLEQNKVLNFSKYDAIVLDEVDRMLDMGFINDIQYIIHRLPRPRQSLFFSATLSKEIKNIMDDFLRDPVSVSVKTRQSAESVNQDIIKVGSKPKIEILHDLLITPEVKKSIIFMRTKRSADKLSKALKERGFDAVAIHGDKTQAQRNKALSLFKEDKVKILLATDVVARGIDIDDVSHVINFDLPQTHEDYIHRIGRTGRGGKIGQALTFID